MSENHNIVETHGCIVCGRLFNVLSIYSPSGSLVNFTVTSPGGQRVQDHGHPLVACDHHTTAEIDLAYQKWLSRNDDNQDSE